LVDKGNEKNQKIEVLTTMGLGFRAKGIVMNFIPLMFGLDTRKWAHGNRKI
jgi:hypothetical protein